MYFVDSVKKRWALKTARPDIVTDALVNALSRAASNFPSGESSSAVANRDDIKYITSSIVAL